MSTIHINDIARENIAHGLYVLIDLHGLQPEAAVPLFADLDLSAIEDAIGYGLEPGDIESIVWAHGWVSCMAEIHDMTVVDLVSEIHQRIESEVDA